MSDALGLAILALPGLAALVAGGVRWRAWRRGRRACLRMPPSVRFGVLLLGIAAFAGCHSIDEDVFAHGPVPLAVLPYRDPITYTVGDLAGQPVGETNGLLASVFNGADYVNVPHNEFLDYQVVDPNVDFDWDASGANPVTLHGGIDHSDGDPRLPESWPIWSIVWEGFIAAPADGTYAFRLHVNNGGWLEMPDATNTLQVVVSCPGGSAFEGDCDGSIDLSAGRHYIRISYYNNAPPSANAHFSWQPPGSSDFAIVPTESLFTQRAPVEGGVVGFSFGDDPKVGFNMGEPVNTFTGNLSYSSTDLEVPARGLPLRLARTYNALDSRAGIFGRGWTSTLEWSLADRGSTVMVTRGDGRRDQYALSSDFTYLAPPGVFDLLAKRADGSFVLTTPGQISVEFSAAGAIRRLTDRNANALAFETDSANRVISVTDGAARALALSYDGAGHVASATDPAGRAYAYTYESGRLAAVTDPSGANTRYAYDAEGRLTEITDALGNVVQRNIYDTRGRVTSQANAVGGTLLFSYDDATRTTMHTDARGNVTSIAHDELGRAIKVTDALGASIQYGYDSRGDRTTFRDRGGNLWRFAYDSRGNQTEAVDPAGGRSTLTYDSLNGVTSRTDANGNTWRYAYDARGNLVSLTDGEGGVTSIVVDASGLPTKVTDADGVATELAYDSAGNPVSVATAAGTARSRYDAAGRLVERTDANGHTTAFAYDAMNRLVRATDPAGNAIAFVYDRLGNVISITDRRGSSTAFRYDAAGRLLGTTDSLGGTTSLAFDANGNRTAVTDAAGRTLRFEYDALDRIARVTDPGGGMATLAYDVNGNLVTATDPRGNTARFQYDFRHQRTSATDRLGAITRFTYDAAGRLISVTDPLGATTRFMYDRADRFLAATDALGAITRIGYTAAGRRTSLSDPKGQTTSFSHDAAGRLANAADALGGALAFDYDGSGNLVSRTDQLGHTTRFGYDALDRLTSVTDALGATSRLSYDADGELSSVTDANANATAYAYDALGRLTKVTDAVGGSTRYAYDARGLLVQLTDANGHARSYAYDGNRRLSRETDGLGRARTYEYDANGNVVAVTDAKGQRTSLQYDAEDRLSNVAYADGATVSYTRDAAGDRTSMRDPLGTTTYAYDALRRPTAVTDPSGRTVAYGYDANGLRTALTYPDGRTATYAYDALDRLTAVTFHGGTTRYTYDAVGNATTVSFPNGTRADASYDALDRLRSLTYLDGAGRAAAAFAYLYDGVGNVTSEGVSGAQNLKDDLTYTYDALNRLIALADKNKTTRYGYDAVGNRVDSRRNSGEDAESATFDAADQLTTLLRDGKVSATFGYDANGNLVARQQDGSGSASYAYDAADRLTGLRAADREVSFAYDGDGNLRAETASGGEPLSLTYTLDVAAPLTQVLVADDGKDPATYLYGLNRIAAFSRDDRYYVSDLRGSVRAMTDASGKVRAVSSYDPWGVPHDQGDGGARSASLFGYTGERQNPKSDLVHLRARWYSPELGRFLTRDPFRGDRAHPGSLQPYAYAHDNPTSLVDPSGLDPSSSPLFDQLPTGASFTPIADGCTGQIVLIPDFGGALSEKLFGQRAPSLAELGLIPTLACREQAQTKPFVTSSPTSLCLSLAPRFIQPGGVQVLPNGALAFTPSFGSPSTRDCRTGLDPLLSYYRKAGGEKGGPGGGAEPGSAGPPPSFRGDLYSRLRDLLAKARSGAVDGVTSASRWTISEFRGTRIYQRSELIDPARLDATGRTNLERMREGYAPIGPDGYPVNLHHMLQTPESPIIELAQTYHTGRGIKGIVHINPSSIPSAIDEAAWNAWRRAYWIWRASTFE
ncbi:MAG TPA: HNH/ENDO VII family nuclease [Candidatus Limnocylindria bacterium]|nr:HNH/ENDO VII family nuclease [Candidatus Limnocylindria bacterium]